jgi:hypothetical protein
MVGIRPGGLVTSFFVVFTLFGKGSPPRIIK